MNTENKICFLIHKFDEAIEATSGLLNPLLAVFKITGYIIRVSRSHFDSVRKGLLFPRIAKTFPHISVMISRTWQK